jgi:hypothetical protein
VKYKTNNLVINTKLVRKKKQVPNKYNTSSLETSVKLVDTEDKFKTKRQKTKNKAANKASGYW